MSETDTARELGGLTEAVRGCTKAVGRLEQTVSTHADKTDAQVRRIHERIDELAGETTRGFGAVGREITGIGTRLEEHTKIDDRRFETIDGQVREAGTDRKSLWKFLLGSSAGGGLVAGLVELFRGGGHS